MVRFIEGTGEPWIIVAIDRIVDIRKSEISDNVSSGFISSDDFRSSTKKSLGLIEVDRAFYVRRDLRWVLPPFAYRVQLNRQQHWYGVVL